MRDKWEASRSRQKQPSDFGMVLIPVNKEGGQKILRQWGSLKNVPTRMVRSPQPKLPISGVLHPIERD